MEYIDDKGDEDKLQIQEERNKIRKYWAGQWGTLNSERKKKNHFIIHVRTVCCLNGYSLYFFFLCSP